MTSLEAAALWVGLNALLLIFLSARVGMIRTRQKINLGDGNDPEMIKAIRTQGNYIEYAPAAIGGLVFVALLNVSAPFIHILGGIFCFARVSHLLGLGLGIWPQGRLVGTALTMLTLLVTGLWLIFAALV